MGYADKATIKFTTKKTICLDKGQWTASDKLDKKFCIKKGTKGWDMVDYEKNSFTAIGFEGHTNFYRFTDNDVKKFFNQQPFPDDEEVSWKRIKKRD